LFTSTYVVQLKYGKTNGDRLTIPTVIPAARMTVSAFTIDFRPVSSAEVEVPVKEVSLTSRVGEIGWLYQLGLIKCNRKLFDLSIVFSGLLKHHASSMKKYQLGPWLLSVRVRLYVFCWGVG